MSRPPLDERRPPMRYAPDLFPAYPPSGDAEMINRQTRERLAEYDDEAILSPLSDEEMDEYAEHERAIREASQTPHRHKGCSHECSDGRCVVDGWLEDSCVACARSRWLEDFCARRESVLQRRWSA